MAKRIISVLLCGFFCYLLIVPCLTVPTNALNIDLSDVVEFGDWVFEAGYHVGSFFGSWFDDDVCTAAPGFTSRHNFIQQRTTVDGRTGLYYICEYCGQSAGEVADEVYNNYVDTLPVTGYNSSGNLIWYFSIDDVVKFGYTPNGPDYFFTDLPRDLGGFGYYSFVNDMILVTGLTNGHFNTYFEFTVPISGTYRYMHTLFFSITSVYSLGTIDSSLTYYDEKKSDFFHCNAGFSVSSPFTSVKFEKPLPVSSTAKIYFPVFEIIPDTVLSGDTYNVTTRPTTITGGNYGIVGDDGQLTIVTVNDTIVNETNNTYYNPATGEAGTINSWTYDYSDRSYNVTLESGDTVTVTYGDQHITIVEGDTNYTIYYVIDGGCTGDDGGDDPVNSDDPAGSDSPSEPSAPSDSGGGDHEHSWIETDRTDPACILPGQINFICENCGQTRVDVLPAVGHIWYEKSHVPTTYDDEGNLIQRGYTIYECSVCGEQYKDENGTGPPGSSGNSSDGDSLWSKIGEFFGTLLGGLIDLITAVAGKILDALIVLGEMLMGKLAAVVELVLSIFDEAPKLFAGFLAFLSAMFPFLPDEIMLLLTFGIAAVVFIGIIKAIRR